MRANTTKGTRTAQRGAHKSFSLKGSQRGFTIVETVIVLAVTGLLFVSVINAVSGRQGKAEFNQAINDIKSQLDLTINQVATGNYPDNLQYNCGARPGPGIPSITPLGSNEQGTNDGCIFLGRVIHFAATGSDPEQFFRYTIAGRQFAANSQDVTTSLKDASPTLVTWDASPPAVPTANYGDASNLLYGLATNPPQAMYYTDNSGTKHDIGSFALVSSLGSYTAGKINSGSSQVNLLPIASSTPPLSQLSNDSPTEISAINRYLKSPSIDNDLNPAGGVAMCFSSGSNQQSGLITIGLNNQTLGTTLKIYGTADCT